MADIYDMLDTWAASGTTFTAIKMNVTDTNSAAGSLLMDLQVGGVSQFNVSKAGELKKGSVALLSYGVVDAFTVEVPNSAFRAGGAVHKICVSNDGVLLNVLGFSASSTPSRTTSPDIILTRDAANTLAQRNGVNAQAFNLYNTYTDASNYERGFMRFVSNVLQIGTEKLGTGTARALVFQTGGTTRMTVGAAGGITFNSMAIQNGNFYVSADGNQIAVGGSFGVTTGGEQGPIIYSGGHLGWFSGTITTSGQVPDLRLYRDAADNLAQRRGTNAQTSRLYGTYTDGANYRRLTKTMSTAGVAEIKPEGAGTGASGNVLHISGLPTANPGPGILWNNAGTPAIGT